MRRLIFLSENGGMWSRVAGMAVILFFIYLADAILSDWVPAYMQDTTGSSVIMGLIMAFSSVIGFGADLVFPQLLKTMRVRWLLILAMVASLLFAGSLLIATIWPWILVFLVAMAVWGIYYEFLGFANQEYVAESVPTQGRAGAWAVIGVFRSLAYILGPLIGGWLVVRGEKVLVLVSAVIVLLAYLLFMLFKLRDRGQNRQEEREHVHLWAEMSHWWALLKHVWPVILMSLVLGWIDSTFWTTGTVWTDVLAERHAWGGLFLSTYMLPSLFVGFVVAKWGVYKGKKKWAERFMILGGLVLATLALSGSVWWQLGIVLLSSVLFSFSFPLVEATYTDIIARMGREDKHMIGMASSTTSLAYVVGPILAGLISSQVGEQMTFAVVGVSTALISGVLLLVTPRKLRLPQQEIVTWS